MTEIFQDLINSNSWDQTYKIPTCPMHSNSHIYAAYATRVIESQDGDPVVTNADGYQIRFDYEKRLLTACEFGSGMISTWPSSPISSHDDAYGAGFLNREFAGRCLDRINWNDGVYATDGSEARNVYRFFFFDSAMRAWAQFRVGLLAKAGFIGALLFHLAFTKKGDTSGHLLLWLAFPAMRARSRTVSAFIDFWSVTWTSRGYTPKIIFNQYYLTECPWFGQWARNDWK